MGSHFTHSTNSYSSSSWQNGTDSETDADDSDYDIDEDAEADDSFNDTRVVSEAVTLASAAASHSISIAKATEEELPEEVSPQRTTSGCPICMEPWTSSGPHRLSCLACGHLYGESCIRKWISLCRTASRCPQCNRRCRVNDVRVLYADNLTVVDGNMVEEMRMLRADKERLMLENRSLRDEKYSVTQERDLYLKEIDNLKLQNQHLTVENQKLHNEQALSQVTVDEHVRLLNSFGPLLKRRHVESAYAAPMRHDGASCSTESMFSLQSQCPLNGAKYFDMDLINHMLLVSQKASELGSVHYLTKMSLLDLSAIVQINLPVETGAVRDLHIAPSGSMDPGSLALVASKKLSVLSFQSDTLVLTYELEAPAWSCAWDSNDPNRIYAGLQNGKVLTFDVRNTRSALCSFQGLSTQPIHTIYSIGTVQRNAKAANAVLCASFLGPSTLLVDDSSCGPLSVPGLENHGVCMSLAYSAVDDIAVASYRPKAGLNCSSQFYPSVAEGFFPSQVACSQIISPSQCGGSQSFSNTLGSHYVLTKNTQNVGITEDVFNNVWECNQQNVMHGNVSGIGMSKSAVFSFPVSGRDADRRKSVFTYGDTATNAVTVIDMQSSCILETLKPHEKQILDIKHGVINWKNILGCISQTALQIYACQQ